METDVDYRPTPCPFTPDVLVRAFEFLPPAPGRVLDPFAGNGIRFHECAEERGYESIGVEIEAEFGNAHPKNIIGNATRMSVLADSSFDAVVTSPTYGNRAADTYDGRDGSDRMTYRLALGHELTAGSTAGLQWGAEYRSLHALAWMECRRVLKPRGVFVLNMKDHVRGGARQLVANWHVRTLMDLGFILTKADTVPTPGMRFGANSKARVDGELVVAFELDPQAKDGRLL